MFSGKTGSQSVLSIIPLITSIHIPLRHRAFPNPRPNRRRASPRLYRCNTKITAPPATAHIAAPPAAEHITVCAWYVSLMKRAVGIRACATRRTRPPLLRIDLENAVCIDAHTMPTAAKHLASCPSPLPPWRRLADRYWLGRRLPPSGTSGPPLSGPLDLCCRICTYDERGN
jgi:hypothetical protein